MLRYDFWQVTVGFAHWAKAGWKKGREARSGFAAAPRSCFGSVERSSCSPALLYPLDDTISSVVPAGRLWEKCRVLVVVSGFESASFFSFGHVGVRAEPG